MDVLERIKALCKENGESIASLEKSLNYSNGSLSKAKDITGKRIMEIANHFGVSMDYLMTGDATSYYLNPDTARKAQELFEQPGMRILFDAARDSTPEDLQMAAELLERLKRTNTDD